MLCQFATKTLARNARQFECDGSRDTIGGVVRNRTAFQNSFHKPSTSLAA